jgi:hypothetical protein
MPRSLLKLISLGFTLTITAGTGQAMACDDACKVDAAERYLQALLTHDASAVPLAPHVWRIENNRLNVQGEAAMRKTLETSPAYKVILGLRDKQFYVAGNDVFAIYTVDAGIGGLGQLASARTFERFRVIDGRITQIEIVTYTSAGKARQPAWPAP